MRRGFLQEHNLIYAEDCRLGEDFLFYTEALMRGARYTVLPGCGYAALVRENSLSGHHSLDDLKALHVRELQICRSPHLAPLEQGLLKQRARSTLRRIHHREVLARKASGGSLLGVAAGLIRPTSFVDIFRDRMRKTSFTSIQQLPRTLLPKRQFETS
jgi:succinoglycan biosynthesis protein ExoU